MRRSAQGIFGLLRVKHWIKNGLILLPLIFSGNLFHFGALTSALLAVLVFSTVASLVYIINDICDVKRDRLNKLKKHRPLASGVVRVRSAIALALVVFLMAVLLGILINLSVTAWLYLAGYFVINLLYSFGLKNIPIVDVAILAAGFVLRVLFGAAVIGVDVSNWLYLSVLGGALYMGLGKRRGELRSNGAKSRKVNKYYTIEFLDKNMYVSMALLLVFYSLWAVSPGSPSNAHLTIPLLILVFMAYSLAIEKDSSSGDPVEVFSSSRPLMIFAAIYVVVTVGAVYL